jgi:hypothetical protein
MRSSSEPKAREQTCGSQSPGYDTPEILCSDIQINDRQTSGTVGLPLGTTSLPVAVCRPRKTLSRSLVQRVNLTRSKSSGIVSVTQQLLALVVTTTPIPLIKMDKQYEAMNRLRGMMATMKKNQDLRGGDALTKRMATRASTHKTWRQMKGMELAFHEMNHAGNKPFVIGLG